MADLPEFVENDSDFNYSDALTHPVARKPAPPPLVTERNTPERRRLPNFDLYLALTTAVLCAVGLLMVYSASIDVSFQVTGEPEGTTYFFIRQLRSLAVGGIGLFVIMRLDYHIWRRLAVPMMFFVIMLLIAVLRFGETRFEAQRTLIRGSVQPGELAKFTVVLYMAAWLASKRSRLRDVTYGIIPFSILVGTVAFLIVLQPDLSTAASILATAISMFFVAGADWKQLTIIGGIMGFIGYQLATKLEYAQQRLNAHAAAIEDLTQASEHVRAAVTAFINGGLFGKGLGEGTQKYNNNLPFPHTDSIFAVIGEELGLVGCFFVVVLFVVLIYRGLVISRHAPDTFGGLLVAGVTCWLAYDAMLNIAVMTALVPPTGVPLPFISFGGSSLVATLAGVGLMLSVSRAAGKTPAPEREPETKPMDWREKSADYDLSGRNRGRRVSSVSRRRGAP